jgi:hypothetical protein
MICTVVAGLWRDGLQQAHRKRQPVKKFIAGAAGMMLMTADCLDGARVRRLLMPRQSEG